MTQPHDPDPERDWGGPTAWQQPQPPPQPPQFAHPPAPSPGPPPQPYGGHQAPPSWAQQPQQPPWQPGPPPQSQWPPGPSAQAPPTYLLPAILVTLFCFPLTGVAAIVFAARVSGKLGVGDFAGAQEASRQARLWVIVSLVVGVVLVLLYVAGSSA